MVTGTKAKAMQQDRLPVASCIVFPPKEVFLHSWSRDRQTARRRSASMNLVDLHCAELSGDGVGALLRIIMAKVLLLPPLAYSCALSPLFQGPPSPLDDYLPSVKEVQGEGAGVSTLGKNRRRALSAVCNFRRPCCLALYPPRPLKSDGSTPWQTRNPGSPVRPASKKG